MPHLVQMHKKYADKGLAVITVAVDDPRNEKTKASLTNFLKRVNATFSNFILDEKEAVWQKKFGIEGIPYIFVFNREGKYKRFEAGDIDEELANVEKLVVEWLKARASERSKGQAQVEIKPVTRAGLEQEIERHKGKVVLLNYWALF